MWKVKRMNRARIVVLTIALGAGGVAAYLASGPDSAPPPPTAPVAQVQTVDVLVAKSDIGLGQTVTPNDVLWQTWPAAAASNSFIRRSDRPDAPKEVTGSIARSPFIVVNLATAIPAAPGNIGTLELAATFALTTRGVPQERAAAFALLYHGVQIVPLIVISSVTAALMSRGEASAGPTR